MQSYQWHCKASCNCALPEHGVWTLTQESRTNGEPSPQMMFLSKFILPPIETGQIIDNFKNVLWKLPCLLPYVPYTDRLMYINLPSRKTRKHIGSDLVHRIPPGRLCIQVHVHSCIYHNCEVWLTCLRDGMPEGPGWAQEVVLWENYVAQIGQVQGQTPVSTWAGNIQGQVGWTSEHPDLGEGVPGYCRGVGLNGF